MATSKIETEPVNMSDKMQRLDLLDAEDNKICTLYVSIEDELKAKNDLQFASALLKYAKENKFNSGTSNTASTSTGSKPESGASDVTDSNEDTKSQNEHIYIWNKKETLLLISLYKENEEIFTSGKMKQYLCWERIATEMTNKDCNISGKKCCTKFQTLKRTYKQIKDHNNKSGNSRKTWEYFDAMDDFCGTKPWLEPISTASLNQNIQPADLLDSIRRSKDKIHSKQTLLEYRKLRAEKRDAQHKEKMELLKDIKNLIQET